MSTRTASLGTSRTVALPFYRIAPDHPHLFQVNPDVEASLALEQASLFLAAAHEMAKEIAELEEVGDSGWGVASLIKMATAVVDSIILRDDVLHEPTTESAHTDTALGAKERANERCCALEDEVAALQRQRDTLLSACRRAVLALAHAASEDKAYLAEYESMSAVIEAVEATEAAEGGPVMAKTTLPLAQAEQVVMAFFGRSPQNVVQPLHRAVEAMNWLGALFQCIETANNSGDRAQSAALIQALSSLGVYVAADYQVNIIGEAADDMQACLDAAKAEGGAA